MIWRWQIACCVVFAGVGLVLATLGSPARGAPTPNGTHFSSRSVSGCVACHVEAKSQPATSMAHALETVEQCQTLSARPLMTFQDGKYSYRIERHGDQSSYTVSDGLQTLTLPIRWGMGASTGIGQTYILEKDGRLYESRVSYFRELNALGITLGGMGSAPNNIVDAAGRLLSRDGELDCFGCHSTNARQGRELTLGSMTPGVRCDRCHGPSGEHAATMSRADPSPVLMKDLSKLSADQAADFCGQCHRTLADVAGQGRLDITDLRFQPYRLTTSDCFDPNDPRISCLACHDPHHEVDRTPVDYDSKCQACHAGGKPGARQCKVASSGCVTCHMPKIELPGAHFKFSDHRIRVVKANEPFPG